MKGAKAAWRCDNCDTNYSEQCIPDGYNSQWGKQGPICLFCHSPLRDLADPSEQLPFWQVVPYFLVYPLHYNALLLLLIGAGGVYAVGGGIPGYIYSVIFSILSIKYWLAVVLRRADGGQWAPSLIELAKPDPHFLFFQMLGIYVLFAVEIVAVVYAAIVWAPPQMTIWIGWAAAAFVTLALPASMMVLATDKNLFKAVNPLRLFGMMFEIGFGPYMAMWIMTALLGVASGALSYWVELRVSDQWLLPALTAIGIYFTLVLHALLGYVLFQYRDVLDSSYESNAPKLEGDEFRKARLLGAITVFERKGDDNRLREPMRDLLDVFRDDIEVHKRYQSLLMRLDDHDALAKHTDYLLGLLFKARKTSDALKLVQDVHAHYLGYRLRNATTALALAQLLSKKKEYKLLVQVTANLHKRVPTCNEVAGVYKLVAQALAGPLNEPAKAKAVAAYTMKTYPSAPEAKALAKLVRSL
ncbi:hypothetical protein [Gilvimarinus gilvus]|uniref:hypothetical protein n=1 Tax=Gilvimarinus gilvus TaxID=3058038 RepID=UPI0026739DF9|nr:hypothetical protein [Gilvimarinus sp. SDUM040013]